MRTEPNKRKARLRLARAAGCSPDDVPLLIARPMPTRACEPQAFDERFKSELSCVVSKLKQELCGTFVDRLLTLFQLPSIIKPGQPTPPNLATHRMPFAALRKPPPAFDADESRYQYFAAWHSAMDASGELKAFETAQCAAPDCRQATAWLLRLLRPHGGQLRLQLRGCTMSTACEGGMGPRPSPARGAAAILGSECPSSLAALDARGVAAARGCLRAALGRLPAASLVGSLTPSGHRCRKLLQTDFFSRAAAAGLLPSAAHKWNLGALAYFVLFTQARLTIKKAVGGLEVYGNLKDSHDALAELERIQDWLMDPIACPTSWPVLLKIRDENPQYAATRRTTAA